MVLRTTKTPVLVIRFTMLVSFCFLIQISRESRANVQPTRRKAQLRRTACSHPRGCTGQVMVCDPDPLSTTIVRLPRLAADSSTLCHFHSRSRARQFAELSGSERNAAASAGWPPMASTRSPSRTPAFSSVPLVSSAVTTTAEPLLLISAPIAGELASVQLP